ncbi:sodium/solute symporter [Candidatus Aminicenantes bacterium AC-334-K16]|jgi:SSS family solute:Na+ symporter|nr:sodium/solute symporter [Candidatus Aminicenantes bacterium AC-334-K16]
MAETIGLTLRDVLVFVAFFAVVVGVSMYKSRREETGEDFFLASRGLVWPLIGLSLIAANISTEHFVGMAGQGAGIAGMAVAGYEWLAAVTLVFVALFFLPKFLKAGIYTIPEYLEYRYNTTARTIMAVYTMIIYVAVTIAAVIYSGGVTLQTIFGNIYDYRHLLYGIIVISFIAALYTIWGGLKAVAWADLFQGSALIIGGLITLVIGFKAIGFNTFFQANASKLHVILPRNHPVLPWTVLVIGLWIPNFYYWGLNQYITQRTLAAKTLKQGQLGIIFAAFLKLIIPFVIILPGIMAYHLYGSKMTGEAGTDAAYPMLIRNLVGPGARAFIFAAISGAVISSLASMLNSASTIFTIDLFKRHLKKDISQKGMVWSGRLSTLVFVIIGAVIATQLGNPRFKGIFNYIQEFQGYISPGILAAFVFGLFIKRTPPVAGVVALLSSVPIYGFLQLQFGEIAFLNRMAITFGAIIVIMTVLTLIYPLKTPKQLPVRPGFDMKPARTVVGLGIVVILLTIGLYILMEVIARCA